MSVVVAVKENGKIYMGADSQVTSGYRKMHYLKETGYKIQRLENGILVGFVGRAAVIQEILSLDGVFTLNEKGDLDKAHIVKEIVPKITADLKALGGDECSDINAEMIVAFKDKMYTISDDLSVLKANEFSVAGAGQSYAGYALDARKDLPVRERILKSLSDAAKFCESVDAPFVLIDTEKLEYEIAYEGEKH